MFVLLAAFGAAFAAFCVWLGVRIVNRRERWAKRAAIGMLVCLLPMIYILSAGIHEYFMRRNKIPSWLDKPAWVFYAPCRWAYQDGPKWYRDACDSYLRLWRPD